MSKILSKPKTKIIPYYFLSISIAGIIFILSIIFHYFRIKTEIIFLINALISLFSILYIAHWFQSKFSNLQTKHQKELSILRHDIKGLLSPALLMADRILLSKDINEKLKKSAETIIEAIEKITQYLNKTK